MSRLLLDPPSAQFDGLRSVESDGAGYVCGHVRAKDRAHAYSEPRAFVYTVSIDFARIDDDGAIAQRHAAYRACPVSVEDEKAALTKVAISPGAVQAIRTVQTMLPAADTTALSALAPGSAGGGVNGTMEQQLQQFGGAPSATSGDGAGFKAAAKTSGSEADWREDKPPAGWPVFPAGHPLGAPRPTGKKMGDQEALAMAKGVEEHWADYCAGKPVPVPVIQDVRRAELALLAIHSKSPAFAEAWGRFIKLRAIDRALSA